ncbi:DDB1- and CUL4-associated factor 8 [Iris pallida]|uniref:DDB1- and CUL4-associated factor 8 n=1 Tax=Iris pallida TaxID=29817 RepID=A0AAX6I2Y2_IRIPA|nr:DDB1- and CUL4-associated factor 8 [Iris pallida]
MESSSRITGSGCPNIWQRELGLVQPQAFTRGVGGSEAIVKRLDRYGKLNGHKGCVNTVHFNPTGDLLVSGSDDKEVIIWNWLAKTIKLTFSSGHVDNIFQARIMPFADDRTIITSSADGQVRLAQIPENGEVSTKRLATHRGRVHKLAIEPGSPHIFYSCGEDGLVQHFDLRNRSPTKLFTCTSFSENKQPIRLNAIVIDPRNPHYFSIGGFDQYARVYDIRNYQHDASVSSDQPVDVFCPRHLTGSNNVHITALAYSITSELLVSYNDELIYLFQKNMGYGPKPPSNSSSENSQKLDQPQVYSGHRNSQTVKGVNFFGPNDEYVVSGSDCGNVYIWKKKKGELVRMMLGDKHIVNCVEPHPFFPFLATSGFDKSVKVWAPIAKKLAPLPKNAKEIMAANKRGREARARITLSPEVVMHLLRLQRRQALAYVERRPPADFESDDDEESEALIFGFADDNDTPGEGPSTDPRECNIS